MTLGNPAEEEELKKPEIPSPLKPIPESKHALEPRSGSQPQQQNSSAGRNTRDAKDSILSVARKLANQPLQNFEPAVWGVLTAISNVARQRSRGMHILLRAEEHCLGRSVADSHFLIVGYGVSAYHCKIYRKQVASQDAEQTASFNTVFLKDNSHQSFNSDVPTSMTVFCKDEFLSENKRLKGLGIGAPEGPVSLDDVRSLQRSNKDLRKQLESHVHTIETVRAESRAIVVRHENEMKELRESISQSYIDKIKKLSHELDVKQKELADASTISAERQHAAKDLTERLSASIQSRADADQIIQSQKATISELDTRLIEEQKERREEREKATADLKAALQRAQFEAQEEIKRQNDAALRQERGLQEAICKLQESDKESRALVETLRSKLEDARESFVVSEKKVRRLEVQLREEQLSAANGRKRAEILELEVKRLKKEVENEKVAREEAWAKVSALELEMAAAIRELSIEKQRFQGARERIILRETQLRAFYSTTEEISALFAKQQEQLKAMQKTLEDEENYTNTSVGIDLTAEPCNIDGALRREREAAPHTNNTAREASTASTPKNVGDDHNSSNDVSATEKHEYDIRSQEDSHTQDAECTSADRSIKPFGSDIDGIGTAPILDGDPTDTERVPGTESQAVDTWHGDQNFIFRKCSNPVAGETMQIDDDINENGEPLGQIHGETALCSQSNCQEGVLKTMEDTEVGTIRTADLLASEVAGSWAISTAPSVHGENDSQRTGDHAGAMRDDEAAAAALIELIGSDGQTAGSQNVPSAAATARLSQERRALNAMIGILAPDFKDRFGGHGGGDESGSTSDADTQGSIHDDYDDKDDGDGKNEHAMEDQDQGKNVCDGDIEGHGQDDNDAMVDDDATQAGFSDGEC
ncbi:hypothetical protein ACLOJK_033506 [Asimina triloba]